MGITVYANSSGRARLWINGNLTTDYSGQPMATGGTIYRIEMNGTIGQPGYDAPAHYRQFDRVILTDNWQDIINGGYIKGQRVRSCNITNKGKRLPDSRS